MDRSSSLQMVEDSAPMLTACACTSQGKGSNRLGKPSISRAKDFYSFYVFIFGKCKVVPPYATLLATSFSRPIAIIILSSLVMSSTISQKNYFRDKLLHLRYLASINGLSALEARTSFYLPYDFNKLSCPAFFLILK